MMSDPNSSATRRRSLGRLLDYSLSEASELGLDDVAQFLALASASLETTPTHRAAKKARKRLSGETVVSLAEFRAQDAGMARRSRSHGTQK